MPAPERYCLFRAVIAICALLSTVSSAFASAGCDSVNAGTWNVTLSISGTGYSPQLGFAVGEKLHIAVSLISGSGGVNLGGSSSVLATTPAPGNIDYTVTDPNDLLMALGVATGSGYFAQFGTTATCDAAPAPGPSKSDASQAVTKGFLLSRINGMLLNDPTNASLLNRWLATSTPTTTAMGNGAMNVASRGGAFGSGMSIGAGLGNAMGLGGASLDNSDTATAGGQTIEFSQSLSQLRRRAAQAQTQKDRMALGAGDGGSLPLAYEAASPWDLWVEAATRGSTTTMATSIAAATSACSTSAVTIASPRT